jgi:hypothetical protein
VTRPDALASGFVWGGHRSVRRARSASTSAALPCQPQDDVAVALARTAQRAQPADKLAIEPDPNQTVGIRGAGARSDAPGVRSAAGRRLVEDPHDAIRVWIDKDAVTVDEGGAHSTGPLRNGRIARRDLAGRGGACEASAFLWRYRARPVWLCPLGRAWRRRGFKTWPNLAPDQSLVLRVAGGWDC